MDGDIQAITRNDSQTIGTTSVQVLPKNPRLDFSIVNTSTGGQIISLALSDQKAAEALKGIVLQPGQYIVQSADSGYLPWQGVISAISSIAGGTIAIFERVRP